jgi:sulfite exporter TauE/SafE
VTAPLPILASALVLGFAGSIHCVGMCGGIAGALAQMPPRRSPIGAALRSLLHSAGRLASYATAGAIAGAFGGVFAVSARALFPIRLLLGVAIVAIGVQIGLGGRVAPLLERAGMALWHLAAPLTRRIGRPDHAWQVFAMGVVWGWLPCGLVYSALLIAAASGEPATGALAMAAFGVGTLPAVLAASGLGAALARIGGAASVRRSAGGLLVTFGLWSIVGTWSLATSHAGHHAGPGALDVSGTPAADCLAQDGSRERADAHDHASIHDPIHDQAHEPVRAPTHAPAHAP